MSARALIAAGGALLLAAAVAAAIVVLGDSGETALLVPADSVAAIDPASGTVDATIPVGASPGGVAAGQGAVWVANTDDGSVSRVDPRSHAVRQTIRVGAGPAGVAAGGRAVWVANGFDGTLSRIDPTTNEAVQTVHVGNGPTGVAYGDGAVWVANSVDGTVSRIDPESGRVTRTVPAIVGASGIAVGFGRVWVVSPSLGVVASLDPRSGAVVDRVAVGVDPDAVAVGAEAVWVANRADGTVSRIEPSPPAHVTTAIAVGRAPDSLAVTKGSVWVANEADGTLTRIDAAQRRPVKTVALANPPEGLAVSRAGVYAAVRSSGVAHRGGTLRIVDEAPGSIDPALGYGGAAWAILSMTNDGLVGFRRVGGIEGVQLVPDLAVSLPTPSDGGTTYTFRLRPSLHYSSGRTVEPEDFRRELERIFAIRPVAPGRQYFADIIGARGCRAGHCDLSRGIVTDDEARTISFHLTTPDAGFLAKLALPFAFAVPPRTPAADVGARALPATGPYMVAAYRKNRAMTMVRNPRFREWSADAQPAGYPDVLAWTFLLSANARLQIRAVNDGSADVARSLLPLTRLPLQELATRFPSRLHLSPLGATTYFFLNTRVAPFNDVRVRRAVDFASAQQAQAKLNGPGHMATCQIVPPDFPAFRRTCPYSGAGGGGARRLAGSRGAKAVSVWVPASQLRDGRYMISVLESLGFRARLKTIARIDAYFNRVNRSTAGVQVGWYAWVADYPSEVGFLPPLFRCNAGNGSRSGFCSHRVDRMLSAATGAEAQNPAAAPALWQKAERAILARAPIVPLYNPQDVTYVSKRVGNFQYHTQWGVLLDQLWVK